jgi:hypothetical protein
LDYDIIFCYERMSSLVSFAHSAEWKWTAMTTTKRIDAPSVALAEGYYYENGCTIASKVHLTERNYGTRRTFFFLCEPAVVQAILPAGWILRATADPEFHLMVHFNDWLHTSHADNTPHVVQAPPYVGFLVPVQNSFLKRSGIMQVYGFAAGTHYTGGPYKAYRGCTYSHSSRFDTNGLDASWTHDQYEIGSLDSAGVFEISIAHQRTVVARAITGGPNLAVFSPYDNSIERYYAEDLVLERPLASSLGLANVKDFSLTWTLPDLKDVMASAKLVAMNYNPAYMREVFERD